jgi:hypothetical protein
MKSCLALLVAFVCVGAVGWIFLPPYSFDLTCSLDISYRNDVAIEVDGRRYAATTYSVRGKVEPWASDLLSGCNQRDGMATAFRLADNRLVLIPNALCPAVQNAIRAGQTVDVGRACEPTEAERRSRNSAYSLNADGYIIDNAERPRFWSDFKFDDFRSPVRLVSRIAEPSFELPRDNIEEVAPNILRSSFDYDNWSRSPEPLLQHRDREIQYRVTRRGAGSNHPR